MLKQLTGPWKLSAVIWFFGRPDYQLIKMGLFIFDKSWLDLKGFG